MKNLKSMCQKYNVGDYYSKMQEMLNKSSIKSTGGIVLQCIFDKNLFDKTVYAALPRGKKRGNSSEIIENMPSIEKLDDKTLIDLQFRVILTDDFLLNPSNLDIRKGFKVNAYAQDQKALEEFHRKVDEFFEGIKKDLEQKNNVKKSMWGSLKSWFGFGGH
jgi:hypothetical protein